MIELRGITWNHERGYGPLEATAAAYMARHPQVSIRWQRRTLQEFGDYPVERLAQQYDLLIIDHPFVGFAAADGCLLPLDELLDPGYLADQAANSVGPSHASYVYGGQRWALAVDAAGQVSAYRPDLLERLEATVPGSWDEVLALADRARAAGSAVAIPLIPIDAIMSFFSLCANAGEEPCATPEVLVSRPTGRYALDMLRALRERSHPGSIDWNPPTTLEQMSTSDAVLYCPLLFGYSNYARPGYRPHQVRFSNIPSAGAGPRGGILGGTGIAIASRCAHVAEAVDYASWVVSPAIQRSIYFSAGGQPGHRSAWLDPQINAAAGNFFLDTLETLDRSYLRPRYNGYMHVQDAGGPVIHRYLRDGGSAEAVLDQLDAIYRATLERAAPGA